MSVKRYSVGVDGIDPNGNLVKYTDYTALEQKLADSQREFRAADATIENLQMQVENLAAENAGLKQGTPDLQTMMSALDAFFADEEVPERAMLAAYNILRGAVETQATDAYMSERGE